MSCSSVISGSREEECLDSSNIWGMQMGGGIRLYKGSSQAVMNGCLHFIERSSQVGLGSWNSGVVR